MKIAANVIAVAGWLGFLAALWWPLVSGTMPPVGAWFAATVVSLLVGLVIRQELGRMRREGYGNTK